jgi:hypothetical protein
LECIELKCERTLSKSELNRSPYIDEITWKQTDRRHHVSNMDPGYTLREEKERQVHAVHDATHHGLFNMKSFLHVN